VSCDRIVVTTAVFMKSKCLLAVNMHTWNSTGVQWGSEPWLFEVEATEPIQFLKLPNSKFCLHNTANCLGLVWPRHQYKLNTKNPFLKLSASSSCFHTNRTFGIFWFL